MNNKKEVRVWVDGCFDVVHFGHANALRQAKQLGDYLIVGVHNDEEVTENKGPPVFSEQERYKIVKSIKWVDQIVENAPYITQIEYLDKYNCDFCAHGDDASFSSGGEDTYHIVKELGRYKEFKRTDGISTTDLVGRMLLATRAHHSRESETTSIEIQEKTRSKYTGVVPYMPNTLSIMQFCDHISEPMPGQKVVYAPGSYDMFHVGHVMFLEKCREIGEYIIVGLYSDQIVNQMDGVNYPIMNINERVLSVLANRHVSNVIIGAPLEITKSLISQFKIDYVVVGVRHTVFKDGTDPFEVAKKEGIFRQVDSGSDISTCTVLERIINNRMKFEARNRAKQQREIQFLEQLEIQPPISS